MTQTLDMEERPCIQPEPCIHLEPCIATGHLDQVSLCILRTANPHLLCGSPKIHPTKLVNMSRKSKRKGQATLAINRESQKSLESSSDAVSVRSLKATKLRS